MTIAHVASTGITTAATAYGSTSITVAYTGVAVGRMAILTVATKLSTAAITTPSGWNLISTGTGGTGAAAATTGTTRIAMYWRLLDGSETGNVTIAVTGSPSASVGAMSVYSKTAGNWAVPMGNNSSDTTAGTNPSAAGAAWITALAAGDMVVIGYAGEEGTTTAPSAYPAIAQTSATFGARTARNYRNNSTGTTNALATSDGTVTTGNANAPTLSATWTITTAGAFGAAVLREFTSVPKTAPTFPDTQFLVEGGGARSLPAVSTNAGDYLVIEAGVEAGGNTAMTVSGGGLTYVLQNNPDVGAARAEIYQWTALATGGSVTVALTPPGSLNYRARVTVVRGTDGVGSKANNASAATVLMARTGADSAVIMTFGDWSTGAVGTPAWTPGGATIGSQQGTSSTYISGRWDDSNTENPIPVLHGISSPSYTTPSIAVLEMLGTAGGASVTGSAALSSESNMTVSGTVSKFGASVLSVQSNMTAIGTNIVSGSVAMTIQSNMNTVGARTVSGSVALSSESNMTVAASTSVVGASVLSGQSNMTVAGSVIVKGATALSAQSTMTTAGTNRVIGSTVLSGQSNMITAGVLSRLGSVALTVQSNMTVNSYVTTTGIVEPMSSSLTMTTAGNVGSLPTSVNMQFDSSLTVAGMVIVRAASVLSGQSNMTSVGSVIVRAATAMSIQSNLSVQGKVSTSGSAVLSAQSNMTVVANTTTTPPSAALSAQSSMTVTGSVIVKGQSVLSIQSNLSVNGFGTVRGVVALSAQSSLITIGTRVVRGAAVLSGQSNLTAAGFIPDVVTGQVNLAIQFNMTVAGNDTPPWVFPFIEFGATTVTSSEGDSDSPPGRESIQRVIGQTEMTTTITYMEGG